MTDQIIKSSSVTPEPPISAQIDHIYVFDGQSAIAAANTGSFETNFVISTTAGPHSRVGTAEIFSDEPSAVIAGVEHGATSVVGNIPAAASVAGRLAYGAFRVGAINDTVVANLLVSS